MTSPQTSLMKKKFNNGSIFLTDSSVCQAEKKKKNITVGREDGEEYFTKGMENIFQKIIVDDFPTVEKKMPHFVPELKEQRVGREKELSLIY